MRTRKLLETRFDLLPLGFLMMPQHVKRHPRNKGEADMRVDETGNEIFSLAIERPGTGRLPGPLTSFDPLRDDSERD
jgi:hypothetical protein